MKSNQNRIDLHHHIFSSEIQAELARRNIEYTGGMGVPQWSMPLALETMARHGIATAIASIQPFIYWGDVEFAKRWARHGNELLARTMQEDGSHFGSLAAVPLPDVAAANRELEYAFDVLKLDGVTLLTSYDDRYLGDPAFEEFFQELNRRNAVVVLHPNTQPPGSAGLKVVAPASLVEFVFDSTRCVANLLYTGTLERYPNIRYVVPHAGGTVPYLASRIEFGEIVSPRLRERVPKGAVNYLRNLYYDTAVATSKPVIAALQQFVPSTQVVFGSDFPYLQGRIQDAQVAGLDSSELLDEADQEAINRGNALRLFPRFAGKASAITAP